MVGVEQKLRDDHATAQLMRLPDNLATEQGFIDCLRSLESERVATFDSVWGSACALLVAMLCRKYPHVLVITPDHRSLDDLQDDLTTFYSERVERYPACILNAGPTVTVDQEYGDRLRLLKSMIGGDDNPLVLCNIQSLLQPAPSRESIQRHSRRLSVGDQIDLPAFTQWLIERGFHQTSAVELPGEFSSRGGIIDLFAPDWASPIRVELFDDEIESLRQFDVGTQCSVEELQQLEITVLSAGYKDRAHFFEFLPKDVLIIQVEPNEIRHQAQTYLERSSRPAELFGLDEVNRQMAPFRIATASRLNTGELGARWQMPVESIEKFSGDIGEIRVEVERLGQHCEIFLLARVEGEIARVDEILGNTAVAGADRLHITTGCAHAGFRIRRSADDFNLAIVGCDQLFHRTELRRRGRRRLGKAIDSFLDLKTGDLIVHLSHGIGRFRGLKMLDKDGQRTEHLELEFYGGTRIYVPASKIDLVQKYVGGTKTRPVLAKIGGKSWLKQKAAAESAVTDLASEMIEIQAGRASRPGIAFGADTVWQQEFEQSFPYRETHDQITAIESIKQDMQLPKPMDRLLCGDVGFGKTEVAMRAAFKAVENGYQVGLLVPTTILAEQHYRTFTERMGEFPLEIAKLSRFNTARENRKIIERLKAGKIDIVIGTHRLVSKDVDFFNVGLVIIDEEQRFGVEHKERLKNLRASVDILTMSATPIPRTLHMSLVGVRDISNLETAPEDRMAVETRVTRTNNELIRNAILRELSRGGQIFFVHNRINDIHQLREKLESLVPEASFVVGHGQMPEGELEKVMTDFIAGHYDVLLATTIIESGLDIPNANTIFIDQADRYGLSDLHQLRGRVGRYKHRAFCYLLLDPHKHLNPTAAKRLQAIETFSEMGAGFQISMRDLEIRGAGNLLGTQQSGHIAAVGYELYCQLLETAVRAQKQLPAKISIHVDIDLPVEAYLPDDYVDDRRQKIDLYRRLTRIERFDQITEIEAELRDRFGPLPPAAKRLLKLTELKLESAMWQISEVFLQDTYLGFRFQNRKRFEQLTKIRKSIRIVDHETAFVTLKTTLIEPDRMLALVKSLLQAD